MKAMRMNQGYLIKGVTLSGVRASIRARKHRNGCGAKGGRKVDIMKYISWEIKPMGVANKPKQIGEILRNRIEPGL